MGSRSESWVAVGFAAFRAEAGFDLDFEETSEDVAEFSRLTNGFLAVVRFVAVGKAVVVVAAALDVVLVFVAFAGTGTAEADAGLLRVEVLVVLPVGFDMVKTSKMSSL